jgi:hypothetical protein
MPMREANHHAYEAQRNIRACASCHREDFCMSCHAGAISPHPIGFAASKRCEALSQKAGRMCLRCHISAQTARCE